MFSYDFYPDADYLGMLLRFLHAFLTQYHMNIHHDVKASLPCLSVYQKYQRLSKEVWGMSEVLSPHR